MPESSDLSSFFKNATQNNSLRGVLDWSFMRGSFRVATFFDVPVRVHWTFGLLILFVIYVGKMRDANWLNIGIIVLLVLLLFVCVLLHEFGHALSAKYYGIPTRDITILPIGGMARLDRLPDNPIHEFVVAIAGPLVNLAIFGLLYIVLSVGFHINFNIGDLLEFRTNRIIIDPVALFLANLLHANLLLAVFNMVPAFPLDGGRVLRALLSIPFGRTKATAWAVFIGQTMAIMFFILAILPLGLTLLPENALLNDVIDWEFQPVLMLISFFVIYTARHEYAQVLLEQEMTDNTIARIMSPIFTRFQTIDVMHSAIQKSAESAIKDFLVFDNEQILRGLLLENDIQDAQKNSHFDAFISSYTTTEFQKARIGESIKSVYDRMMKNEQSLFPVLNTEGVVVGVVDYDMMEKFMKGKM